MERSMWCSQTMVSFTITEKTCAVSVNNLVNHDFTTIPVQPILYHRACLISWSYACHKNQEQKKITAVSPKLLSMAKNGVTRCWTYGFPMRNSWIWANFSSTCRKRYNLNQGGTVNKTQHYNKEGMAVLNILEEVLILATEHDIMQYA